MTRRLYYDDAYQTELEPVLIAITEHGGRPAILLDETFFYPTSGGQPFDTGVLADRRVEDVVASDGHIYHILDKPVDAALAGQTVLARIDWPRRFDHMQQHSGQHLISQVFHELFDYQTVSVHFGDHESTLDLDTPDIPSDELSQAEHLANQRVFQAIPIKSYFVSETQIAEVPLRRPPKVRGEIRIVEIQDLDWSACGGTHTRTTAEIGPIKFIRQQHLRGQTRVSFLCGGRALDDYARKHDLITTAANLYDNEIGQVPVLIERDMERLRELQKQVDELQTDQLAYIADDLLQHASLVGGTRIVTHAFDALEAASLKTVANLLIVQTDVVALLGSVAEGKATVTFARGDTVQLHAGTLLRATLTEFGGGGGGRPELAQGGGVAPERVPELLDYALSLVRQQLEEQA